MSCGRTWGMLEAGRFSFGRPSFTSTVGDSLKLWSALCGSGPEGVWSKWIRPARPRNLRLFVTPGIEMADVWLRLNPPKTLHALRHCMLPCCKLLIPGSAFNSESLTYLGVSCFWTIVQGFSAVSLAEITNSQSSGTERRKRYLQDVRRGLGLGLGVQVFGDFIHAQPPQSQVKPWRHVDAHRHNVTPSDHVSHQHNSSDLPPKNKCSQTTPNDQSDGK